jgi:transcriptional regulator with XRE-family HTH domain
MRLRLKVAILAAGKSQRQVALETNLISENKLSDIVRGWTEPRDDEKAALARVLAQPVDQLFEEPTAL